MAKVTDMRDLLVHELAVVYASEKTVESMLPKLAREANDEELSAGLERHREETRAQIENLERAFELLGEKPRRAKAPAMDGLQLQHKAFAAEASEDVLPEVLDLVTLSSATATEHHEIAAYEALITLARTVGAEGIVEPLLENLEQEERMLGQAQGLARRLGAAEAGGVESGEEDDRSLSGELAEGIRDVARRFAGEGENAAEAQRGAPESPSAAPTSRQGP
jgi:ferritin-like metal-binding protein YciE